MLRRLKCPQPGRPRPGPAPNTVTIPTRSQGGSYGPYWTPIHIYTTSLGLCHLLNPLYLQEPQLDVLATIVIDCTGDCILPRLTVDKKGNPDVEEFPAQNKELSTITPNNIQKKIHVWHIIAWGAFRGQ